MIFTLPVFNLTMDIWDPGHSPALADPPDFSAIPCQLYVYSRAIGGGGYHVRLAKNIVGLTITPAPTPPLGSATGFEIPAGSGKFYAANICQVLHMGFPNEYWQITLNTTDNAFSGIVNPSLP